MNTTNTTNYSMAIFSCMAIAALTFFFPLGADSRYWTTIVIGILLIFTCLLYIKQDELKAELGRSFNTTLALVMSYVLEVVLIALVLVIAAAKNGETTLGLKPDDAAVLTKFANVYVYMIIFMLQLQNSILGTLAGEQGRRAGLVSFGSMALAFVFGALYYVSYFDLLGPGFVPPAWAQTVGFLSLVPGLLRLRVLESYGHI